VFSHEKGDLALNIELVGGIGFADITVKEVSTKEWLKEAGMSGDAGARVTANYYFFDWLSVNTGIGFGIIMSNYMVTVSDDIVTTDYGYFDIMTVAPCFSIPIGFRFNARAFVIGGGLAYYIPLNASSEMTLHSIYYKNGKKDRTEEVSSTDDTFEYKSFLCAYADIGFDLGGRSGRKRGFGMLFRFGYNIPSGNIGSSSVVPYDSFEHKVSFTYVFNYSFPVASFPIGGK
jgi:hypothetical protein